MTQAEPAATPAAHVESDRAGHIEVHGIDYIPESERGGKPRSLFWVWMSANVVYLYFVYGGLLMLLGLGLWDALLITVIGNIWWVLVGVVAISGPASGTPTVTIMRSMFGIRGNRVFGAALGVFIGLFYEVLNIAFAVLATTAFLGHIGIEVEGAWNWVVLLVIAAASFGISVYGHGTILKLSPIFTAALAICFVLLAVFVFGAADFSYVAPPLSTGEHWVTMLIGLTVIASNPLSWGTSADYARYLPTDVSKKAVIWWTALGGFIPAVVIGALGVIAGTVVDMTDPQLSIAAIVPVWFYPIFLFVIVLGSVTNNVLLAYSTGLYFQALGFRIHRAWTVVITGVIATGVSAYVLFAAPSFLDTLNYAIEVAVAVVGPLIAVYAVDVILRRNRYDGLALNVEGRRSAFWYSGGVFWPGVISMVVAVTLAVLMVNTDLYQGPIAVALGGADLSSIAGPLVGGGLYAILWLTMSPYRDPSRRPAASVPAPDATTAAAPLSPVSTVSPAEGARPDVRPSQHTLEEVNA